MRSGIGAAGRARRSYDHDYRDQFPRNSGRSGRSRRASRRHYVRFRNVRVRRQAVVRSRDMDLILSLHMVWMKAASHRPALAIRYHAHTVSAPGERSARSLIGKREDDRRPGNRLMILVFHLDDGLARCALLDIVDRALAFYNHDVQHRRRVLGPRRGREWNRNR